MALYSSRTLHVSLYDNKRIEHEQDKIDQRDTERALAEAADGMRSSSTIWTFPHDSFDSQKDLILTTCRSIKKKKHL